MNTRKLRQTLSLLSLVSFTLALNSCITIRDHVVCTPSGKISNGALCAHTLSNVTFTLSSKEALDLLDAQPLERKCVQKDVLPVCSDDQSKGDLSTLPPRGASVIMDEYRWNDMKTELEQACRELGSSCNYEQLEQQIDRVKK